MNRSLAMLLSTTLATGCALAPDDNGPSKDELASAAETSDLPSIDWCERKGWYDDGECDWFCLQRDPDCDVEPLGPPPSGAPAQLPIVFTHGFMASPDNFWSFYGVPEALEADGHMVFEARVQPFASSETRAVELAAEIERALDESGASQVHLVAHSMGGLDARIVASPGGLDISSKLASVTTIGTAHRGTLLARAYLGIAPEFADKPVDWATSLLGELLDAPGDADLRSAMESLAGRTHPADLGFDGAPTTFAAAYPDAPGLYYQSWAGVSTVTGRRPDGLAAACDDRLLIHEGTMNRTHVLLWGAAAVAAFDDGPHDGMIAVSSTKHGEFKGCIPADHLDLVGQIDNDEANRNTGFDHIRFYRNLAFDLADRER